MRSFNSLREVDQRNYKTSIVDISALGVVEMSSDERQECIKVCIRQAMSDRDHRTATAEQKAGYGGHCESRRSNR